MRRLLFALIFAAAPAAHAEVVRAYPGGFSLKHVVQVAGSPEAAYRAIGQIGGWWNLDHTYGGKAEGLTLELAPGGCFCERLPGGGVRHGVVVMAQPGKTVRLDAALGPLQAEGVSAALTFALAPKDGGTEIVMTYNVGGGQPEVAEFAKPVDSVMSGQMARLKAFADRAK